MGKYSEEYPEHSEIKLMRKSPARIDSACKGLFQRKDKEKTRDLLSSIILVFTRLFRNAELKTMKSIRYYSITFRVKLTCPLKENKLGRIGSRHDGRIIPKHRLWSSVDLIMERSSP